MGLKPSNMYKASTGFCWGLNHTTGGAYGVQNYWHSAIFTPFSSMNAQCFPTIIPPTSIQMSQSGARKSSGCHGKNSSEETTTDTKWTHMLCNLQTCLATRHLRVQSFWPIISMEGVSQSGGVPRYPMCLKSWLPGLPFGSSGGTNCPTQFLGFQSFYGGVLQLQGHDHLLGTSRNIDKVGTPSAMFVCSCWPQETIVQ